MPHIFPRSWGWRRVDELRVTIYQCGVGCVFWFAPDSLNHSIYDNIISAMPPGQWAVFLWCVCLGHMSALYLNGRMPLVSSPIRVLACTAHGAMVMALIEGFWGAGVYWPIWTYICLVGWHLAGAFSTACDDVYVAIVRSGWIHRWLSSSQR